jgi:hypothetical protein
MKRALCLSVLSSAAAAATAQVTPIAEFVGTVSEGFESFATSQHYPTMDIMGGFGMINSNPPQAEQMYVFGSGGWGLGFGAANVHSGNNGLGLEMLSPSGPVDVDIVFDSDVLQFGGWFSTDNIGTALRVTFFADGGGQIDSVLVDNQSVNMAWFGWQSAVGIRSIKLHEAMFPAMDDFQANPVPEPGTMIAIGLGLSALALRRRTRS